jgi:hypothetical protein
MSGWAVQSIALYFKQLKKHNHSSLIFAEK